MSLMVLGLLVGGLVLLVIGGELLISSASKIAGAFGVSALVIGLTIVAFGTSAPELVVSLKASLTGNPNIAVANVVGSNIFNVLLILGACALFAPLVVSSQLVRLDVPLMIVASLVFTFFAQNGNISRPEGLVLFSALVIYTVYLIKKSRSESKAVKKEFEKEFGEEQKLSPTELVKNFFLLALGLGLLVVGGGWLVDGAVQMAQSFGVSDTVIGLTIVAAGTSLPEVATSILATIKGERDIAIGNVVGSNIFNILNIVGLSSIVVPSGLVVSAEMLSFDIPVMIAAAIVCLPIFIAGFRINRWEGVLLFVGYISYTTYLVLNATQHELLGGYRDGLLYFVLPAMGLTLAVITYQAVQTIKTQGLK